ncbi:hypothetical protein EDC19_1578 [Natranaerovirga hydrolytica]|uniref:DUF8042 domain-containing protein n=1 Tax=Natranaerovirga hydrolytica TaxID=680378 RepID=A0A4R1MLH9_9FIRM|nr:hypothetical protein [Natranaerovirga hydrolytica]TCK93385.1 hypothetical protein EDC19_1578 [Natranaerovirga hydrolytica]
MENYYDVIIRLLDLLDTVEEGFFYSVEQIKKDERIEAFNMLKDISDGIETITNSLQPILMEVESETDLLFKQRNFMDFFEGLLHQYENNKEDFLVLLEETIKKYNLWKNEIEKTLKPFVLS